MIGKLHPLDELSMGRVMWGRSLWGEGGMHDRERKIARGEGAV